MSAAFERKASAKERGGVVLARDFFQLHNHRIVQVHDSDRKYAWIGALMKKTILTLESFNLLLERHFWPRSVVRLLCIYATHVTNMPRVYGHIS